MADLNSRVDNMKVIGQDDKVMEVSNQNYASRMAGKLELYSKG